MSPDKPAKQKKFDEKYSLGFPLLADEDHAVAEAFDVWTEKSMYGRKYMGILRLRLPHRREGQDRRGLVQDQPPRHCDKSAEVNRRVALPRRNR